MAVNLYYGLNVSCCTREEKFVELKNILLANRIEMNRYLQLFGNIKNNVSGNAVKNIICCGIRIKRTIFNSKHVGVGALRYHSIADHNRTVYSHFFCLLLGKCIWQKIHGFQVAAGPPYISDSNRILTCFMQFSMWCKRSRSQVDRWLRFRVGKGVS